MNVRRKKTVKNTLSALVYQTINLIVGFFLPKLIIGVYGSEINGLSSNINQYLNILNLLQAGIIAASAYEMYKPITNEDYKTIGTIYYSARKYFNKCSYILLFLSITVIPFMLYGKTKTMSFNEMFLSVLILGLNSFIIFKYYCKFDLIFSAHQEKYTLVFSMYLEKSVYYILLFMILYLKWNYNWMYLCTLFGTVSKVVYLHFKFRNRFEVDIKQYNQLTDYRVKNQYHVLGNQIVFRIMDTFPIIAVTRFYNFTYASIYSVYILVIAIFKMIFDTLQNSIAPSFGDLFATGNKKRCIEIFETFQLLSFLLLNVIVICLAGLFLPFIRFYIGNVGEVNYIYSNIAFFITLQLISYSYFFQFNMIVNTTGIYRLILKGNIVIACLTIIITLGLTMLDFQYIYSGIFLYYLICSVHNFIVIRKYALKISYKCLIRPFISIVLFVCSSLLLTNRIYDVINNNINYWIIACIILLGVGIIISLLLTLLTDRHILIERINKMKK